MTSGVRNGELRLLAPGQRGCLCARSSSFGRGRRTSALTQSAALGARVMLTLTIRAADGTEPRDAGRAGNTACIVSVYEARPRFAGGHRLAKRSGAVFRRRLA